MSFKEKYIKYKEKYLNLKNKIGGKVEGRGAHGIVYSTPRLPYSERINFKNNYKTINTNENLLVQVSKIFKSDSDYIEEKDGYINILHTYKRITGSDLPDEYFNIPISYGKLDKELIREKKNLENKIVYDKKWSDRTDNYEKSNTLYQITFNKGLSINQTQIYDYKILYKFQNIVNCMKFMIDNNLIYDDLKLGNILEISDKFKISDFGSLIFFSDIDLSKYNNLQLHKVNYPIYLPLLNKILEYCLKKKEYSENLNMNKIVTNGIVNKILEEAISRTDWIKWRNNLFDAVNIFLAGLSSLNEIVKLKLKLIASNTNENINLIVGDIIQIIRDAYSYSKNDFYIFFSSMVDYLNIKFPDNIDDRINYLIRKINIYMLGVNLINILKILSPNDLKNRKDLLKSLLEIIGMCCIIFYKKDKKYYITEYTIDEIKTKYDIMCSKEIAKNLNTLFPIINNPISYIRENFKEPFPP